MYSLTVQTKYEYDELSCSIWKLDKIITMRVQNLYEFKRLMTPIKIGISTFIKYSVIVSKREKKKSIILWHIFTNKHITKIVQNPLKINKR